MRYRDIATASTLDETTANDPTGFAKRAEAHQREQQRRAKLRQRKRDAEAAAYRRHRQAEERRQRDGDKLRRELATRPT